MMNCLYFIHDIFMSTSSEVSSDSTGIVQEEPPLLSNASVPPKMLPFEKLAISLDELNRLTVNFGQMSLVARGSYGRVFRATLSTGEDAAIKKLNPPVSEEQDFDFEAELSQIYKLKHDNFVELLGYCLEANNRILVYQFATMGSLHDILHGRKGVQGSEPGPALTWIQRMKIFVTAARGLEYLHSEGIIHGNISSSNILVFDDSVAKIADFNFTNQSPALTEGYSTSESTSPSEKSDVYALGVVLLELVTGRKAFDDTAPEGEQNLATWWVHLSALDEPAPNGELSLTTWSAIDPKLNTIDYPKAVEKAVAVAELCLDDDPNFRPSMYIVVKAMQPLMDPKRYYKH